MASPVSKIQRLTELGVFHCQQGNFTQGIACFEEALTLQPDAVDGRYNLALAYQKQGDQERALAEYKRLLAQQPDHVPALVQAANLQQMQQQYQAAIALYHKALTLQPQNAQAHCNLGTALQSVGNTQAAIAAYEQALALHPQYPEACNGLGSLRERQGLATAAIALYEQALARKPNWVPALLNLAQVRFRLEQWEAAIALYRQVLALEPNNLKAWDGLLGANLAIAQWDELDPCKTKIEELASIAPLDISPLNTLYLSFSAAEQRRLAEARAGAIARRMADTRNQLQFLATSRPTSKIRLGYVSGDFRHHAVAHLMLRLFELHDRQQFEVFAYSLGPDDGSTYRQKLMVDCDQFRDVLGLSPTDIARSVHQDGIDILIDLAGYTDYGCPELFALRPAPIQINYLGYPGTLGNPEIGYILTDSITTPPELTAHFTESCLSLPGCYQINNNQQPLPSGTVTRTECGLPEEAAVFCCFNKVQKIEPTLFAAWMRILQQVPQSVLWLLESNPLAQQNLVNAAGQLGVAGDRLIFAPRLPKAAHLDRHPCADLFLDTRYYNAHTTGSDALWAGVPLITLPGETFASRVSASLLHAVNLPELIANSLEDYERLAIHLATHPEELARLRQHLQENRLSLPLFESDRTVRNIEAAYRQIWEQGSRGAGEQESRGVQDTAKLPSTHSSLSSTLFSCHATEGFHDWLAQSGGSIAISTYQAGKVVLIGFDGQQTTVLLRQFTKPMGMAMQRNRWVLATQYEVLWFANSPLLAHEYLEEERDRYDALYLPRVSYYTNDLNIHDLAFGHDTLWLVNTRFSCLAALSEDFNFVPRWQPPFITELAPEDRCHLNGLAIVEGKPKYVTALGATDTAGGWREHKATGGILMDVEVNELVLQGLCMPHSPRWHDGYLWFLNSGAGEVCRLDVASGQVETVCVLPGFLRGLECVGSYALVGLSQIRERHIFGGLPVSMRGDRLLCGVAIIDLKRGNQVGMMEFTDGCQELYDVKFLAEIQRPMLLNLDKSAVREAIAAPNFAYWLRASKQLPT